MPTTGTGRPVTTISEIQEALAEHLRHYADEVRDELESERADHDQTQWRLIQLERKYTEETQALRDIKALVFHAERAGINDRDTMGKIRGILYR